MSDEGAFPSTSVSQALDILKDALARAIRAEQLHDRLTGLVNDEALTEWIENTLEEGRTFWAAFIEVDRFKNINDKYGYRDANILLKRIGGQLQIAAADFFPTGAVPVRAHGDEFFLVGKAAPEYSDIEGLARALDDIRRSIAAIRIKHREKPEPMSCTVSIGWLLSSDVSVLPSGITTLSVRGALEMAVAKAKLTRNCVVQFDRSMTRHEVADGRADCSACEAKFSLNIPLARRGSEDLWCPNCGARITRPVALQTQIDARTSEESIEQNPGVSSPGPN